MATITFGGEAVETIGHLPELHSPAPALTVVDADLNDVNLSDFAGKRVVLNFFPSIDTGVCAASVRRFNEEVSRFEDVQVIGVSKDLPFALARFCGSEGIDKVLTTSAFRSSVGEDYGITMQSGPAAGLFSRAIVVIDEGGHVVYTEQVPEVRSEPNYEAALDALGA